MKTQIIFVALCLMAAVLLLPGCSAAPDDISPTEVAVPDDSAAADIIVEGALPEEVTADEVVEPIEIVNEYKPDNNMSTGNNDAEAAKDNYNSTDNMEEQANSFKWEDGAIAVMVSFGYCGSDSLGGSFDNWPSVYNFYADEYSIFADVPVSDVKELVLSGDEVYCIIPRYKNTRIIAKPLEWPLDFESDNVMKIGDIVFDEITKAFVINCNVSDLYPNVQITIVAGDKETTFSPYLSLGDDGEVIAGDAVQVLYLEGV